MYYYLMSIAPFMQGHLYLYIAQALNTIHSGTIVVQIQTFFFKNVFCKWNSKNSALVQGDHYLSVGEFSSFH